MRKTSSLFFIFLVSSLLLIGCGTDGDVSSENSASGGKTTTEANSNWNKVISANGLPSSVPAFQGDGDVEYTQEKLIVYNNDQTAFEDYLSLLEANGWTLVKRFSDIQKVYANGDSSIILDILYTYESYSETGKDKATVIKIKTGDEAAFLISNYAKESNTGSETQSASSYKLTKQLPEVELTEDNYMSEASAILDQIEEVLDEAYENVKKAAPYSTTKQDDLKAKIDGENGYREKLQGHRTAIADGGYYNSFTDELYPADQQYDKFVKNIGGFVDSVKHFIESDYNTAYKYK